MKLKKYKLGDVGKIITGKTPPTNHPQNYGGDIPFLTPSDNLEGILLESTAKYLTPEGVESVKNCILPPGSVCVSCIGSDLGQVIITKNNTVTNQQFNSIIPTPSFDFRYLYYRFTALKTYLQDLSSSSTSVPIISKSQFSEIELEFPNISVQRNIANILYNIDRKIALNREINRNLEALARQLYDYWFVQFDFPDADGRPYKSSGGKMVWNERLKREIPEGWSVLPIGEILDKVPTTKKFESSEYNSVGTYPIIDQGDSYIVGFTDDVENVLKKIPAVMFGDHSTRVKLINFPFGRGADGTQILYSKEKRISIWQLYLSVAGLNIPNPGYSRHFKYLKELPIIVPTENITTQFEKRIKSIFDKWNDSIFENIHLTAQRDEILPLLMNGQVSVRPSAVNCDL